MRPARPASTTACALAVTPVAAPPWSRLIGRQPRAFWLPPVPVSHVEEIQTAWPFGGDDDVVARRSTRKRTGWASFFNAVKSDGLPLQADEPSHGMTICLSQTHLSSK